MVNHLLKKEKKKRVESRELTDLSVVFPVRIALALALVSGKDFMYESYKSLARARRSADSGFSWSMSLEISAKSFSFSACGIRPNLIAEKKKDTRLQ